MNDPGRTPCVRIGGGASRRSTEARPIRVGIVGGGFGGLYAAMYLEAHLRERRDVEIVLISRDNFFLFSPMLHEVATGAVEAKSLAEPIRALLQDKRVRFIRAEVTSIDLERRIIMADGQEEEEFTYLVIALGSVPDFGGVPGAAEHALPLKNLANGIRIRNQLIARLEQAERETDPVRRRQLLTFVVVGASSTGVEVAPEIQDLAESMAGQHGGTLDPGEVRTILVASRERVLPELDEPLAAQAMEHLMAKGIEIRFRTRVARVGPGAVHLDTGDVIAAATVIWAGGVRAHPLTETLPVPRDPSGRIIVNDLLEVPEFPGIYAVGDCAHFYHRRTGRPLSALAQVAMRQGVRAAANIASAIAGRPGEAFDFSSLGKRVSLGRRAALVDILGWRVHGLPAWLLWKLIFLSKLIGIRPKLRVGLDWLLTACCPRDTSLIPVE